MYRFAFRFLNDEQEAQDVVQEVLIKAWEKRQSLLEVKNVKAWCLVVTKNIALNRLRGKRDNMVDMQQYLNLKSKGKDPYQKMCEVDQINHISSIIDQLPSMQREVIQLRDIEQLTYREIGAIMEIDVNHVKVLLHRARRKVKEELIKMENHGISRAQ